MTNRKEVEPKQIKVFQTEASFNFSPTLHPAQNSHGIFSGKFDVQKIHLKHILQQQ